MKILVTGGGSGGHMYPALAIAEKFKKEGFLVSYVGTDEIESVLWPRDEFDYNFIHARGFEYRGFKETIKTLWYNLIGLFESFRIIRKKKPNAIIGTGGYVQVPLIIAGFLCGIPCYLQEQNAICGRANLFLERFVKKVFLGFDVAKKEFKNQNKMVYSGNPVRDSFKEINRDDSRKELGFNDNDIVILMTGGSHGAPKINEVAIDLAKEVYKKENIKLIISTGKRFGDKMKDEFLRLNIETSPSSNVLLFPYISNMPIYVSASDLIIERSGAVSVAETLEKGIPSIMIPSTYVYKNHQFYNAKVPSDYGASILMEETNLEPKQVVEKVLELINDKDKLSEMSKKANEIAKHDTLDVIYSNIVKDIDE